MLGRNHGLLEDYFASSFFSDLKEDIRNEIQMF